MSINGNQTINNGDYDMQFPTIQENNDLQQAVDAKEFYQALGLHAANWSRWHTMNIEQNPFATESQDYQAFVMMMNGNETKNYLLSVEFAKKLAMQVKTEVGERIRNYFLECERKASQPVVALPHDYISALEELLVTKKSEQVALEQVKELQPKAAALDTISHAKGSTGIRETAKAVGMGQNEFVAWCTNPDKPISARFMYRDHSGALNAYSHRIDQGFVTQKLSCFVGGDGRDRTAPKVRFTASGVTQIAKMLQQERSRELEVV